MTRIRVRLKVAIPVTAMLVVAFAVLLWHADWVETGSLHGLTPNQRVIAIDNARGRIIQFGAGLLAAGALLFTALNFWLSREGHVTERFTKAIEQLGSDRLDVRLGAIYALERIMIDSVRDHPTIVEVLAAFVREHAPYRPPDEGEDPDPEVPAVSPPTDVHAAVTVLGRRPADREERGQVNLAWTFLAYANLERLDLSGMNLSNAFLYGASLVQANLADAVMMGTDFTDARMVDCNLARANLLQVGMIGAVLGGANLDQANLNSAHLTGTHLRGAKLTRASLANADLRYANLTEADLSGATLNDANLADAILNFANFRDAILSGANLRGADLQGVRLSTEQLASVIGLPGSS